MMFSEYLENVRVKAPLIHCITNYVTVNDVANIVLAAGASPIMADDAGEVEEITSICSGLNINIGTLNGRTIPSMMAAGKSAMKLKHKILLDPVGAGASTLRTQTALDLLENIDFNVIRGNVSEIKTLAYGGGHTMGVDANQLDAVTEENLTSSIAFVKEFAKRTKTVTAVTGAIDLVTDGETCYVIRNGRSQMGKITGTGCQLSGLITAFMAANDDDLKSAATAVIAMGIAGEVGFSYLKSYEGNMTYRSRIIDAICNMTGEQLETMAKYEIR